MSLSYLHENNLHFKPISAHLARCAAWASVELNKSASETRWHGHVVRALAKVTLAGGFCAALPIAAIEMLALGLISGLGIAIDYYLCGGGCEFLQKHSLIFLSYAINSLGAFVLLRAMLKKIPTLRSHSMVALYDWGARFCAAAMTQIQIGGWMDRSAGRNNEPRILNLLFETLPEFGQDMVHQIQNDLGVRLPELPALQEYLSRHPEDRRFIEEFDFHDLHQAAAFAQRFLADARLVHINRDDPLRFELFVNPQGVADYQEHVAQLLKGAFLELHNTPALSQHLEGGAQSLAEMQASIFTPLSAYTVYKELRQEIQCPEQLAERRQRLLAAKAAVDGLSDEDRNTLVQRILGAEVSETAQVHEAYLKINQLAPDLYHGPLLKKPVLDVNHMQMEVDLFQRSLQEAFALL
jgi:hypothetical protein